MNETIFLGELRAAIDCLTSLAVAALDAEESHPLALPEPPTSGQVETYNQHIAAITQQVSASYQPLLAKSRRDYEAGFPDRAGSYLLELVSKLLQEPESAALTSDTQRQLERCLIDLREL